MGAPPTHLYAEFHLTYMQHLLGKLRRRGFAEKGTSVLPHTPHTSDFRCLLTFLHHRCTRRAALTPYICLTHIPSTPLHLSRLLLLHIISPTGLCALLCKDSFSLNEFEMSPALVTAVDVGLKVFISGTKVGLFVFFYFSDFWTALFREF